MRFNVARTVILALILATAGIWWLAREFDLDAARLFGFLVQSAAFIGLVIVLAAAVGLLLRWLRGGRLFPPRTRLFPPRTRQGKSVKNREKRGM